MAVGLGPSPLEPKLIISLAVNGQLQMELPASEGKTRTVVLKDKTATDMLKYVLRQMTYARDRIGEEGAPTRHQMKHDESHQIFPDPKCPFCRARLIEKYLNGGGKIKSHKTLMEMELDFD